MTIIGEHGAAAHGASLRPITLGWAVKRALLGIAILVLAMGSVAWLTYASIDPDVDGNGEPNSAKASKSSDAPVAQVRL
jgi:hypothetical protein